MSTIYLICSKDKKFVTAFSEEEVADDFIELYSDEPLEKECYILNSWRSYKPPIGKDVYYVKISKDGSHIETEIRPRTFYNIMLIGHVSFDPFENMIINMWASDSSEAEKLVDFIRTDLIIKNKWGIEHDAEREYFINQK